MPKVRWGFLAVCGLAALLPAARADIIIFTLTAAGCGGCPSGPFGTITVSQLGLDHVSVVESLAPNVFANTGAGNALGYTLDVSATVSNLLPAGVFTAGGPDSFPPLGAFGSTIVCSGCGSGTGPPQYSSLSFTLTGSGLTPANFVANSLGYFFASDIGVKNSDGTVIWTGNVGATDGGGGGGGGGGQTPEPATYVMLGGGVLGVWALKARTATKV